MGIYIKGMEMPKSCDECRFRKTIGVDRWRCPFSKSEFNAWDVGWGTGDGKNGNNPYIRHESCPLIFAPPHGRLIDADNIGLTDFEIVMCNGDYKEALKMLLEKIEKAPTIIPPEK